jgi:SpoVK/Ycf46/Vps4 family AAA+-type ATPase
LSSFMGLRERAKRLYAAPSPKNFLSAYQTGKSIQLPHRSVVSLITRYPQTRLLEINSHSLFSKWFSESGKLVQKLFSSITDLVEDEDTFVVVLIGKGLTLTLQSCQKHCLTCGTDEVESLTAARAAVMSGTEPSDGLRVSPSSSPVHTLLTRTLFHCQVVNALLTQLDKLKHCKNVLVMSTSNLPRAIGLSDITTRVAFRN